MDDTGTTVKKWIENHELDGINVVRNFPYYDYEALCKDYDYIKWCFEFNNAVLDKTAHFIDALRYKNDVIIGIHIRRKDYKDWQNGKFYFDDSTYFEASKKACRILGLADKKIAYVICSDEDIDMNNYDKNYMRFSGSLDEDMCILTMCDYIISTQSTFSGWAGYFGKVPAFRIRPEKRLPDKKSDFMIQFFETDGAGKPRINAEIGN